jgi:hypothetical protein
MGKINYNWVKEQFAKASVTVGAGNAVLDLLKTWEKSEPKDLEQAQKAVEIFSKVALGHSLVKENKADEVWEEVRPGFIKVADVVRVKNDAFVGELGVIHNGRVGKIVAIRSGDIIFKSTDGLEPSLDSVHYQASKLEKRIR